MHKYSGQFRAKIIIVIIYKFGGESLTENEKIKPKFSLDEVSRIGYFIDVSMKEGMKKGIIIGSRKKVVSITKKMLSLGISIDMIHQVTDLKRKEILEIFKMM